ncbi:hypothetical protein E0K83_12940 [Gramella sp. BOM4]|nr:hypothetical protein [Christiangramia bathymodioli]
MKRFYIKYLLVAALVSFGLTSCEDDDTLPVDFEDLNASGGPFAAEVSTTGSTDINRNNPSESVFSKTYVLDSPSDGSDVNSVDVYVSYDGSEEALYESIDASEFETVDGMPQFTVNYNGSEILSALGLSADDLEGGATFRYRLALNTDRGTFTDVSPNFDNQSADHTFSSTVVCILPEVPAGEWKVNMTDDFGDGWQTNDSSGGDGLTFTLSNGDVFEVGLCNPYVDVQYVEGSDCIDDYDSGTATFTVPEGVESGEWYFPGDFYGEITFEIIAPSGNVVASAGLGTPAGVVALNLCNE